MGQGGWGTQGVIGCPMVPSPDLGIVALGIYDAHAFAAVLQGVVSVGVGLAVPSPLPPHLQGGL